MGRVVRIGREELGTFRVAGEGGVSRRVAGDEGLLTFRPGSGMLVASGIHVRSRPSGEEGAPPLG